MCGDLKIEIFVKESPDGRFTEVNIHKPPGMNMAEVIGWIEQAKLDVVGGTAFTEEVAPKEVE